MSEPLKVGDKVLYVAHADHWNDRAVSQGRVFHFVHHEDGPKARAGDPHAQDFTAIDRVERAGDVPVLHLPTGHKIKPHRPKSFWPATVVRVNSDGSADLDITHPNGYETHHKPDREAMRSHYKDIQAVLDREAAIFAAGGTAAASLHYHDRDGNEINRDAWRASIAAQVKDADDLTAVPGVPHDPSGKRLHSFHLPSGLKEGV